MSLLVTIRSTKVSSIPFSRMLTSDQIKRLEENKKRAQELFAKSKFSSTSLFPPKNLPTNSQPPKSNALINPNLVANKHTFRGKYKQNINVPDLTPLVIFSLKNETHFIAETKYKNENLIKVFKQSSVWSYDPENKYWSFPIGHYQNLVTQVQAQCPLSKIELIPPTILTMLKEKIDGIATIDDSSIPPDLITSLLPYQVEGVKFCVARNGRAIIADEMGLGKTIQSIAVACYFKEKWPLLIMCPSSLRIGWKEQLIKWVPWLEEDSIHIPFSSAEIASDLMSIPVTILSYDLVVKLSAFKLKQDIWKYSILIADESHFLKNSTSARTKAAVPLLKKSDHVLLLTGTPALSRPIELYPQINAVDRKFKMSTFQFAKRYCDAKQNAWGWDYSGASRLAELQIYLNKRVMIRRNKTDVLPSLPSKTRKTIILKLEESRIKELRRSVSSLDSKSKQERYGCMLELFAQTAVAKANAVCNYLIKLIHDSIELYEYDINGSEDENLSESEKGELSEANESCINFNAIKAKPFKLIVFFHHKAMLSELENALLTNKIGYIKIEGATPPLARQSACDLFQHGDTSTCRVALLSLKSAGTGLTLTAAKTVVFAELFWNPGDLRQAEDRAHRLGQEQEVDIQYLVAQGTIDDRIWPLLQRKLDVLSQAGLANNTETDSFTANSVMSELFSSQETPFNSTDSDQRDLKEFFNPSPKRIKFESSQLSSAPSVESSLENLEDLEKFDSVEIDDILADDWSD